MRRSLASLFVVAVFAAACSSTSSSGAATTSSSSPGGNGASVPSNTVWLCKPGLTSNPCQGDLTATVVNGDGTTSIQPDASATNPPIDCFYVYPTVSAQPTLNANLNIDPAETGVAQLQASRFSQYCRVYAPMYRQLTLAGIVGSKPPPGSPPASAAEAYGDVASAWADYLAHYNNGRGVVLIGHSQGSFMLIELIQKQIENDPAARARLISAILLGGNVSVPDQTSSVASPSTSAVGSFTDIPPCTSSGQTGCVVAFSSFDQAPPANSLFGRVSGPAASTSQVLCTNPASLSGGPADLETYFPTKINGLTGGTGQPTVTTPWVEYPDLFQGECMDQGGASWLQINDIRQPGDTRPHTSDSLGPTWGLHLVDANIALGNLVDLVHSQSESWLHAHP